MAAHALYSRSRRTGLLREEEEGLVSVGQLSVCLARPWKEVSNCDGEWSGYATGCSGESIGQGAPSCKLFEL